MSKFKTETVVTKIINYFTTFKLCNDDPLKIYFESIDWSFILPLTEHLYKEQGSPAYHPVSMFKAFLLIYLGEADSQRDLAEKLKFNTRLQLLCGFDFFSTPTHPCFTNFKDRLKSQIFYEIMHNLISQAIAVGLIKNLINTATDSTHIWTFSNKFGLKICNCENKCKCPRKYSDPDADWGAKSKKYYFFGYKIHLIVDTESQLPLEVIVTKASAPDNESANPLLDNALQKHTNIKIISNSLDAAYDDYSIYQKNISKGIEPIIALNERNSKNKLTDITPQIKIDDENNFFCSKTDLKLVKSGVDKKRNFRQKLLCYPTKDRLLCPFRQTCCPTSKIGKTFYLYPLKNLRLLGNKVKRNSDEWKILYNLRTASERTNSQLKSPKHKIDEPLVRGSENISIHAFLSVSALIVKSIGLFLSG